MSVVTVATAPIEFTAEVIVKGETRWIDVEAGSRAEAFSIVRRQHLGFGNGRILRIRKGVQGVLSERGQRDLAAYHAKIARPLI